MNNVINLSFSYPRTFWEKKVTWLMFFKKLLSTDLWCKKVKMYTHFFICLSICPSSGVKEDQPTFFLHGWKHLFEVFLLLRRETLNIWLCLENECSHFHYFKLSTNMCQIWTLESTSYIKLTSLLCIFSTKAWSGVPVRRRIFFSWSRPEQAD